MPTTGRWCALALATTAIGCGDSEGTLSKAGAESKAKARVLVMGTTDLALYDSPGLPAFVRAVEKRSGGRLRIRLKLTAEALKESTRSGPVARGEVDLGWEGEGFPGIPAWEIPFLPFLIDSHELQRKLFAGSYDEQLIDSLEGTPRVGVAVLAGELARPYSVGRPLMGPADWRGVRLLTSFPQGPVRRRALKALGVEKVSPGDYPSPSKLRPGAFTATEWMTFGLQVNFIGLYGVTGTFNVASFTRPIVVVGNRRRLEKLMPREREWLRQAAADATRVALEEVGKGDEADLALNCRTTRLRGVVASEADVDALRETAAREYRKVKNVRFRELLAMIETARADTGPEEVEVPRECRGPVPPLPVVTRNTAPRALDGRYRYVVDVEDYQAAGMADPVIGKDYAGAWTATLKNGQARWTRRITENSLSEEQLQGESPYKVDGDRVTFTPAAHPPMTLRWSRTAEGDLRFEPVHPLDWYNGAHFGREWERVR